MITLALILVAGLVSLMITGRVRQYALRNDVLDRPNERSSHSAPMPRGGGLAILLSSILTLLAGSALHQVEPRHALAIIPGLIILGTVGWLDDHGGVGAGTRLAMHLLSATAALTVLGGFPALRIGQSEVHLGLAGAAVAAVGIVWSINLFNFMDGIDGIAGSQGVIIFGAGGLLFHVRGAPSLATTSFVLAAACSGFLYWNWPPARIFMGDVGSGALGFAIAVLAVAGERGGGVPLLTFGMLGAVFLADATITLVRRVRRGQNLAVAHRDHAYQRMARAWGAHRPVTLGAGVTSLGIAGVALATTVWPDLLTVSWLGVILTLAGVAIAIERRAPM